MAVSDSGVIFKLKPDARVPPEPPRRKPLNLRPVLDEPGDDPATAAQFENDAHEFRDPAVRLVMQSFSTIEEIVNIETGQLKEKISVLREQVSELKGALVEARHEIRELKSIQESLRISTRGESGRDGARGVPGRDGQQGLIGPQGPPGPRGKAAPRISAWTIDEERFTATPVLSDGSHGPTLSLLGLFTSYDRAVSLTEDRDLVAAAEEARAETERQTESHWAR